MTGKKIGPLPITIFSFVSKEIFRNCKVAKVTHYCTTQATATAHIIVLWLIYLVFEIQCQFYWISFRFYCEFHLHQLKISSEAKGQLISKQNCRAVTSYKKRTEPTQDNILSAFCLFFGRSYSLTVLFQDLLTFSYQ